MERKSINPWSWSIKLGFDQAQLIEGHRRQLVCSGQDAVDADGKPQHPGDMAALKRFAPSSFSGGITGVPAFWHKADIPTAAANVCFRG